MRRLGMLCVLMGLLIALAGCAGLSAPAMNAATSTATATAMPALASPEATPTTVQTPQAAMTIPMPSPTTVTSQDATATSTVAAMLPTATATAVATATATAEPSATATATPVPPTATATAVPPPTATATATIEASHATLTLNGRTIAYSYPAGWALKQETKNGYSQVTLEEPNGALLALTIYGADTDPALLAANLLDGMQKQFSGATVTPLTDTVGGFAAQGYTMKFTYMGVPMTSTILAFRAGPLSFTLYTQAADEDLSTVQPGFDLIKNTLVVTT